MMCPIFVNKCQLVVFIELFILGSNENYGTSQLATLDCMVYKDIQFSFDFNYIDDRIIKSIVVSWNRL